MLCGVNYPLAMGADYAEACKKMMICRRDDDYVDDNDDDDDIYIMVKCMSVCNVFAYFAV